MDTQRAAGPGIEGRCVQPTEFDLATNPAVGETEHLGDLDGGEPLPLIHG